MKKWLKRIVQIVCVACISLGLYWSWLILEARALTPLLLDTLNQRQDMQLTAIPKPWIEILVAVEDPSFWTNDGWDFQSPGQGFTTITQALAKRLYFNRYTPGLEKIELLLFAKFALDATASKEEILNAFLTVAYFGGDEVGPVIGFPEAARRIYSTELSALTEDQFIGLVAMLIAPNGLNPHRNPDELQTRIERIKRWQGGACQPAGIMDVELSACAVGPSRRN